MNISSVPTHTGQTLDQSRNLTPLTRDPHPPATMQLLIPTGWGGRQPGMSASRSSKSLYQNDCNLAQPRRKRLRAVDRVPLN